MGPYPTILQLVSVALFKVGQTLVDGNFIILGGQHCQKIMGNFFFFLPDADLKIMGK